MSEFQERAARVAPVTRSVTQRIIMPGLLSRLKGIIIRDWRGLVDD